MPVSGGGISKLSTLGGFSGVITSDEKTNDGIGNDLCKNLHICMYVGLFSRQDN